MMKSDDEMIRSELIDCFRLILELDSKPDLLKRLPKKSLLVKEGKKRMFIPIKDESKIVVI